MAIVMGQVRQYLTKGVGGGAKCFLIVSTPFYKKNQLIYCKQVTKNYYQIIIVGKVRLGLGHGV